ncbi:MAG: B12-binding domain-containing radical SAM protein [Candidatus Bipolaricaulaceae bacterium]
MRGVRQAVLIEPAAERTYLFQRVRMPRLGLIILGGLLRRMGVQVRIFCEQLAPIDWGVVAKADLVGITALTNLAPRAYRIARAVKQMAAQMGRYIPVVAGGPHPTALPAEALAAGADFVVRGEGEIPFQELVVRLPGREGLDEVPGLSWWEGGEMRHNPGCRLVEDLDRLPLPDFSLVEGAERINCVPVQTSRGCPFDCEFCSVVQMFGNRVRYRTPEAVVEELRRSPPARHLFVVDDNFSAHPDRAQALLEAMERTGFRRAWSTQERVSVARRPEILSLMRRVGCVRLHVGLESVNPAALAEWGKGQSPEEVEGAVTTIHDHGLGVHGMFVLGADADTPATVRKTAEFARRSGLDTAQFFVLTPVPGTRLFRRLEGSGRIFDRNWEHYDGHTVVYQPRGMSAWQLQQLAMEATQRFYTWWRGVRWAMRGRVKNAFFALYGRRLVRRWVRENAIVLARLRRPAVGPDSGSAG